MSSTKKVLLVFCDGTGMDGLLSDQEARSVSSQTAPSDNEANVLFDSKPRGGSTAQNATNVLRLSRSVLPYTTDKRRQIVFYQSGVGSEANFAGDEVTETTTLQAAGTAVASKIRDAYAFIAQNFEDGDEINIFGFSRGAYTARKLSGLIDRIGLLSREHLGNFFTIWRTLNDGQQPTLPPGTLHPRIKCVGVWDTVGSVFNTIDALSIKDTHLPPTIDIALHAVSLQENRKKFLPTLWTLPSTGLRAQQVFKEMWFAGAHSDVGGGYEQHELADLALAWIAGEVSSFINLDLTFLQSSLQRDPEKWGTSQPHNAYMELNPLVRRLIKHETRLESGQITSTPLLHESIQLAPLDLKAPKYMVTLAIIQKKYGAAWKPTYPRLNEFEQKVRDTWGKRGVFGPAPAFERMTDLF